MGLSNIVENISMALTSLKSNKMRSLLTMLGIIIGIAAVIAIETVGGSLTGSVTDSMSGMGVGNITVSLTQKDSSDTSGTSAGVTLRRFMDTTPGAEDLITDEMIGEFEETFADKVDRVELTREAGNATIDKYGDPDTTITASLTGTTPETLQTMEEDTPILAGRWLTDADEGKYLCVVSEKFVEQAIGTTNADAVGARVVLTVNGSPCAFYVAGVYKYVEDEYASMFGVQDDDSIQTSIYIPLETARVLTGADEGYQNITVVTASGVDVTSFVDVVGDYFASYYTRNDTWTASASSISSLVESMTEMLDTISLGISAIAAISLLVGGIGVMNIMTVSVTERTREIGTRKALGAPSSAIRLQFITESIVLCAIGGVIGVILGVSMGSWLSSLIGFAAKPSLSAIVIAVGFSMGIGVFFGYYPANKAAKLDPIDALRYE